MNDAHSDLTVRCYNTTGEENEYGHEERCDTEITYEDHFQGLVRREGWEGKALRLRCPECGSHQTVCPVCHGGGWFRGESTGEMLACHVCNASEYARERPQRF